MSFTYRKDIDGLRAIAVVPVILFHFGWEAFSGGFLGVDVFFVISGFLISSILLNEFDTGKYSILKFYDRRARRILPALFFVLTISTLVFLIFMPANAFKEYSQSLFSVAVFLSNYFFYSEIDYFSLAAEEMPLLHTWSLAIEEQFYLFFPPVLFILWQKSKRFLLTAILGLFFVSFISMLYLNAIGNEAASFYWLLPRIWELLAGTIIAIILVHHNNIQFVTSSFRSFLANSGFIILLACMVLWNENIVHPGPISLIPVISVCIILLFNHPKTLCYRVLANNQVVFVGLISYSLYLWHQPILAMLRMKSIGEPNALAIFVALSLTFFLAIFSYRFIEQPFRNKNFSSTKRILSSSCIGLLAVASLGWYGHISSGIEQRFSVAAQVLEYATPSPKRNNCHSHNGNPIEPAEACSLNTNKASWAVLGDSHAVEIAYGLSQLLEEKGMGVEQYTFTSCLPALSYQSPNNVGCSIWLNKTLDFLEKHSQVENVIVAFRYTSGLYGDNIHTYPEVPEAVTMDANTDGMSDAEKVELYWENFEMLISRLSTSGKVIYVVNPIPELPIDIHKAVTPYSIFNKDPRLDISHTTSFEYYFRRHQNVLPKLTSLKNRYKFSQIDPFSLLCDSAGCPSAINNKALYFDDDHLSVDGAKILLSRYLNNVK